MRDTLFFYVLLASTSVFCQNFINGDLEGPISFGGINGSVLPGWDYVPYSDVNCQAANVSKATIDICGVSNPSPIDGIYGMPNSGESFVSGLYAGQLNLWHEGIMQNVSGFEVGAEYTISFYQSVVKQNNYIDTAGSWAIYTDTTLLGYSNETISYDSATHQNLNWEYREVSFFATATTHTLKFLPMDLDSNHTSNVEGGGLRMGIDNIKFINSSALAVTNHTNKLQPINAYPNPFIDKFTIDINPNQVKSMSFYSLDNKKQVIETISSDHQIDIYPKNNESGLYYLAIELISGEILTRKMIVL